MLIPDPTDNLILHSILDHARRFPEATKALLTDNTRDFDTSVDQRRVLPSHRETLAWYWR